MTPTARAAHFHSPHRGYLGTEAHCGVPRTRGGAWRYGESGSQSGQVWSTLDSKSKWIRKGRPLRRFQVGGLKAMKSVHLKLSDDLHRRLKVKAALEDESIQSYVEKLVVKDIKSFALPGS